MWPLKFLKISYARVRKTWPFRTAAARLIAGCLKSKTGTYPSKTLRHHASFEPRQHPILAEGLRPLLG
jgi:hypothetical protein